MTEDLVRYFNEVLGIKEVLMVPPPQPRVDDEPLAKSAKILVLFIDDKTWSPAASELFQKMRQAMKLTPEQVQVLFLDQISEPLAKADLQLKALSSSAVVNFVSESFEGLPIENQFQTISPSRLIENPALKKEVWAVLQKVMQALSL